MFRLIRRRALLPHAPVQQLQVPLHHETLGDTMLSCASDLYLRPLDEAGKAAILECSGHRLVPRPFGQVLLE